MVSIKKIDRVIIAEVGSVHDGSFGNACKLIEAAAEAGADIVKFQTHIAEAETLQDAPNPSYFSAESRYDYFCRTAFTENEWTELVHKCAECGVGFLSSPFSLEAVELLESIGAEAYKIPSGEVTNTPLLESIAKTGKPVYLSSGMNSWQEIDDAVEILQEKCDLCVLQCTSEYPSPPEHVGLNVLSELAKRYGTPVGFSDHTEGCAAGFAAAALGASVFEKHFTFSRLMYGSDAANGTEPDEFRRYSDGIRDIWKMIESPVDKSDSDDFREMKRIFEKSIVTATELKAGTLLKFEHLGFKKPGDGIPAANYKRILGRRVKHDLTRNHKLKDVDLE